MPTLPSESDHHKLARLVSECREHLAQIEARGDTAEAEAASAAIWDVIMAQPFYVSPHTRTRARRDSGMISPDLARSLASGDYRKAGA